MSGGWGQRAGRTAMALALMTVIVAPLVPGAVGGLISKQMQRLSVIQSWRMYTPDPQRAQGYLALYAELADGSRVALEEARAAEQGWGAVWDWQKRREDIWRAFAASSKPTLHRTWYMRGVCVREDRARGEPPKRIVAERVRRVLMPPDTVAKGRAALGTLSRTALQTVRCDDWPARGMIAADRTRRGLESPYGPDGRSWVAPRGRPMEAAREAVAAMSEGDE